LPLDHACKVFIIRGSQCKVIFLKELAPESVRGFFVFDLYIFIIAD
jgi:hypothetical protein